MKTQINELISVNNISSTAEERIDKAKELDRKATGGIYQLIYALKEISENELYVELGFSSMQAYCQQRLSYSYQSAYMYLQVIGKFGSYIQLSSNDGQDLSRISDTSEVLGLPVYKLHQLSRLPVQQIENLMNDSFIKVNGKIITYDKIKEMSRTDLAEIISSEKKAIKLNMPKPWIERRYKIRQTALKLMKMIHKEIADAYIQGPEREQIERPLKEIDLWLERYFNSTNPGQRK